MMASLFAGVSGLRNHQVKMNVIGNNIANVNTIGFKASRVNFQESLVQTFKGAGRASATSGGTNPVQLGLGMQVATIDNMFQQGGLETTGQITDLAIQGPGFFILGDLDGNKFYSRSGAFGFDANSNLVDPSTGLYVLGKMADATGTISSTATIAPITLPFGQQDPAKATEELVLGQNLNVSASDSEASLVNSGTSNVLAASGTASNGIGGTHSITVTGTQAQNSTGTGTTGGLTGSTTLGSLGITDYNGFEITVDGFRTEPISGMTPTTKIQEMINRINLIPGVTASLSGAGEMVLTRDKAGSQGSLWVETSVSTEVAGPPADLNVVGAVFAPGNGVPFATAGGAATTFSVSDEFTPTLGTGSAAGPQTAILDLVINESTGLVTGFTGLGDSGVNITTGAGGLQATLAPGDELLIETAPTTHTTALMIFDSQGQKHTLSIEFFKSLVTNRWEWSASLADTEAIVSGGTGYVAFNPDGSLNTFNYNGGASNLVIDPRNGASNISMRIEAGTPGGFDGITGFGSTGHTASMISQDGYGLGILEKIAIDQAGNISGIFTNGVSRALAQILLADFTNQAGLRKAGKSMYQPTANSGQALEGVAGETISGMISSGALESSSVDIAQEFTSMITAQRGFQANARVITTSDQLLDELVNIKR